MRFREISHKSIFAVAAEGPKRNRYQLPVPVFKPRIRVNKLNPFLGKIINPRVIGGVVLCSRNIIFILASCYPARAQTLPQTVPIPTTTASL